LWFHLGTIMTSSRRSRMRVVIVDPSYASGVGHHQPLNGALLQALGTAGYSPEVWGDAALPEAIGLRRVSSGCGYVDQRHWSDLAGSLHLAARLRRQLEACAAADAAAGLPAPTVWLAHSLLPFQLIALAQLLQHQPPALVLLSLMFAPGETLGGSAGLVPAELQRQAALNARTALQALAQAIRLGGHQLRVGSGSAQTLGLHTPLLAAAGLPAGELHPAVVGAGSPVAPPPPITEPLVLLHWGDLKADKGRQEARAVLQALLQCPPAERPACRWLFHGHGQGGLPDAERKLLEEAQRQLGERLLWLQQNVPSDRMQNLLAGCDLALLAYSPRTYAERSSGVLWCYAAARYNCSRPAVAVGYGGHWLAYEAQALGMAWSTASHAMGASDGLAWLDMLQQGLAQAQATPPRWSGDAQLVLGQTFANWVLQQLASGSE
jgi:hypothetical protein